MVAKDEEIRKLRVSQALLQNKVDEMREQLDEEQTHAEGLEDALEEALTSLDQYKANAELAHNQIRTQSREVANLKVLAGHHPRSTSSLRANQFCRQNSQPWRMSLPTRISFFQRSLP